MFRDRNAEVLDAHVVSCQWVKGHAGIVENVRADRLASQALEMPWEPNWGYEGDRAGERLE